MSASSRSADYTLDYRTRAARLRVLDDVTLAIAPGEVLGLVGESGLRQELARLGDHARAAGECARGRADPL